MIETISSILLATYSICLPILIKWLHQIRVEKKNSQDEVTTFLSTVSDKIDDLASTICKLNEQIDLNEATTCRYRIIRAADELRNGSGLSSEHLEQLGEDIEIYQDYCNQHPDYKNHKGKTSMALILEYEQKTIKGGMNNEDQLES